MESFYTLASCFLPPCLKSWGMSSHVLSNGLSSLYCGLRSSRLELLLRTGASRMSFSRVGLRIREYVFPARYLAAAEASGAVNDGFFVESMVRFVLRYFFFLLSVSGGCLLE